MINPINAFNNFSGYNTNFRSNAENPGIFGFQYKLKPSLVTDVFERTTSGGVNGSHNSANAAEKLLPFVEIKKFCPDTKESTRKKIIEKEKNHIAQTVTKRTEYNTRQLKAAGVPESDVKKYLTYDGHVNTEGKRILREKGKSYQ